MSITIEQAIWVAANNPSKPPASDVITMVAKDFGMCPLDVLAHIGGYANYPDIAGQKTLPTNRFGDLNTSI